MAHPYEAGLPVGVAQVLLPAPKAPPEGHYQPGNACSTSAPVQEVVVLPFSDSNGCVWRDPHHLFYYRFWFIPPKMVLGVVVAETRREYLFWNAYLGPQQITSREFGPGAEGITTTAPASFTLPPLGTRPDVLTVVLDGPASIDTWLRYSGPGDEARMFITGLRSVLLEVDPNWVQPVRETIKFKTDVWASWSGREQRRAVRSVPRLAQSFRASSRRRTDADMEAVFHRLARLHDSYLVFPRWGWAVRTTAPAAVGDTVLPLDRVPWWLQAGEILWYEGHLLRVEAVDAAASTITLSSALTTPVRERACLVQVRAGRLAKQNQRTTMLTDRVFEADLSVETDSSTDVIPEPPEPSRTWQGYPVFPWHPNQKDKPVLTWVSARQDVDFGYGPKGYMAPQKFFAPRLEATWYDMATKRAEEIAAFFHHQRGRAGEFWLPVRRHVLTPRRDIVAAEGFIEFEGESVAALYDGDTVHRAVRIVHHGGEHWVLISAWSTTPDKHSRMHLTAALPEDIAISDCLSIEFIYRARFASDNMTIEWLNGEVARMRISFQILEAL